MFALQLCPAPVQCFLDPWRELEAELFVERPEVVQNLDHVERRLPMEVHILELFHDFVNERL